MDQLFKYCQLCKRDVSSPALTMKRLNDGRGCPVTGICTRTLLQPALNLVSSFRFKTPDFAPPRRAWAVLLGGNPKAFLDLESLLHRSCTHPALPRPALCPSWLLQVSGQTPNFGSSSMPGEARPVQSGGNATLPVFLHYRDSRSFPRLASLHGLLPVSLPTPPPLRIMLCKLRSLLLCHEHFKFTWCTLQSFQ